MYMKKRKLKKWVYYLIILILLIPILFIAKDLSFKNDKKGSNDNDIETKEEKKEVTYTDIITDILKYDNNDYDEKFLNYIYDSTASTYNAAHPPVATTYNALLRIKASRTVSSIPPLPMTILGPMSKTSL